MTDYVARYRLVFKDLASRKLLRTANVARGLTRSLAGVGRAAAGLGALSIGAAAIANNITSERARLAESVGVSLSQLNAVTGVARQIGLDFDNVVDLAEELNNKVGEMINLGEMTSLQEGLKGLGVQFSEIRDLAPDEQFRRLLDAATKLENVQVAQGSLDQIFGGEASKLTGALITNLNRLGLTYTEFEARQARLNVLTDAGVFGARRFSDSLAQLRTFTTSLASEGFGVLGGPLANVVDQLNEFLIQNKEKIQFELLIFAKDLGETLKDIDFQEVIDGFRSFGQGVAGFFRAVRTIASAVGSAINALGGLEKVLIGVAGLWALAKVKAFAAFIGISGPVGLAIATVVIGIEAIRRNWDALGDFFLSVGERILAVWERIKSAIESALALVPDFETLFPPPSAGTVAAGVPTGAGGVTAGRGHFNNLSLLSSQAANNLNVKVDVESKIDVNGGDVRSNQSNAVVTNQNGSNFPARRGGRSGRIGSR